MLPVLLNARFRRQETDGMSNRNTDPIQAIRRSGQPGLIARLIAPPDYPGDDGQLSERGRVAVMLHAILSILIIATVLGYLAAINNPRPFAVAAALTFALVIEIAAYICVKLQQERLAGLILVFGLFVIFSGIALLTEGIANSGTFALVLVVVVAGLALGGRTGLVIAVLGGLTNLAIVALKMTQLAPPALIPFRPLSFLIIFAATLLAAAAMIQLSNRGLREAIQRAVENEQVQLKANQELQAVRSMLEELVKIRTEELESRSRYLQAAIDVSRAATSLLETEQLMHEVVNLIQAQFDLYYVGLFLLDPGREWAVLRAGTGSAGKAMIERGHRIRFGSGMVGWSIANAQPRIAAEIGRDAVRLATPELPDTRSEAAFPLRSRGEVIGAMTVQSVKPEAFGEAEISTFQVLADQVAVALENARLFSESRQALLEARQVSQLMVEEAWQNYQKQTDNLIFRYDHGQITALAETAGDGSHPVLRRRWTGSLSKEQVLALPIEVRGQEIGKIRFVKDPSEGGWTQEEHALLAAVVDQLGVALDSARLYEETRRRAERERLTGEIITKMRATNDPQSIVQTAVFELRKALQTHQAQASVDSAPPHGQAGLSTEHSSGASTIVDETG